jgi:hypothetical protein
MLQTISDDGTTICDCQKAFGDYSTVGNEMDNDGIHTSMHFKFEWKFETQQSTGLAHLNTNYPPSYCMLAQTFIPSSFIKDIFRPPAC